MTKQYRHFSHKNCFFIRLLVGARQLATHQKDEIAFQYVKLYCPCYL